ncbi:MAG: hypothetical protein M1812_003789 [Candelaria pacifica]|nr:MAG: hypothetical protein M1812_003789 [Candelaria pacifica]
MSAAAESPVTTNGTSSTSSFELDVPKLHSLPSEQQELYLLTFTHDIARHISQLDKDGASSEQIYLKRELFQIINLPSPAPTRVIRSNLGRSFAGIFEKGDRKLLFESINELLGIVNAGKGEKELRGKHAAVHSLGEIFRTAGDSAISLASLACSSLVRLLKQAQNHAGLRASIFKALGLVFEGVGKSSDESVARDVWKNARTAATGDKAALAQASACKCLQQLVRYTPYFDNSGDFESLKSSIWKAIDTPTLALRHAAASSLAVALVKSYTEDARKEPVPKIKKPKKPNKKQSMADEDDEEIQRPESPASKKTSYQLALSLPELLRQLSTQYVRTSTSNRAKAGIAFCYTKVIKGLGPGVVELQYSKIADHLLMDVLSSSSITHNRYRLLCTRKFVRVILEEVVGHRILGETGQLNAAKMLLNDIIKNYPHVIKERAEPSKQTISGALDALASLITSLGSAISSIADSCRDGLLQVLQHPSYTVQIATSHCLRTFVLACPQQLLPCVTVCMNSVNRELNLLTTPRQSSQRCVGYANGLAAVLSTAPLRPLYGSVDVNSRVLSLATGLLKSSSNSELRASGTQIQVAWILIGGLMSLGPNFVKIHLSQVLLLWKNALPKPLAKDSTMQRSLLESSFLAHVRECALGSVFAFLEFNSRLLTTDVSKRLAAMLQNTTVFLNGLPSKKLTEDPSQRLSPSLQLHDLDLMVRRRVLQCYTKLVNLSSSGSNETLLQSNLLTLAVSFFADPENYSPSSLSTSIASSAGSFESLWEVGDNCGFGVTGLVRGMEVKPFSEGEHASTQYHWLTRKSPETAIDNTILSPFCGAREHDSVSLYTLGTELVEGLPDPPSTQVVNSAIHLFAISLPLQPPKIQESILEQLATFFSSNSLQRDPGRKAAMAVNIVTALLATLQVATKETISSSGDLRSSAVERALQGLLRDFVVYPDHVVRNIACEALGRLCTSSGNAFTTSEINGLVDMIVSNRDPNTRAGCAVALGCIHEQVGGMAAGYHLKTILGILMSLSNDPHPTVHFWALEGLSRVAESAGLTFSGYVSSSLGMLARLYVSDTHNEDVASTASSNLGLDFSTPAVIARCVDSLVNVLGPDLQDMTKARDLILTLGEQFSTEQDPSTLIESLRCFEHVSLYASGYLEFKPYVGRLQRDLGSEYWEIRDVAIDGLYNLMRRDAEEVIHAANAGLEDQLWLALDGAPYHEGIRNIIRNWLGQTSLSDTGLWVQRFQNVLTKSKKRQDEQSGNANTKATALDLQDEEVAGFAAAVGISKDDAGTAPSSGQESLRWQVRTFAMSSLSDLLAIVGAEVLTRETTLAGTSLQQKVADVIRMAFSASTSNIVELRVWGLRIIDQILKIFGKTSDPDFAEASLLDQYQAQISSALTPAFSADSSPELASEAVNVCAGFIATGIVTDVERMGRILKLLVSALETFSSRLNDSVSNLVLLANQYKGDAETADIGDLKGLSSNAQVMVKLAVFSAWAELQVASREQEYLVEVVKPHIASLTPLWLSSLREFARLRFEPDISTNNGPSALSGSLDTVYAALNRETLLKFYQNSWLNFVDAIASLIDQDSDFVFNALDGKHTSTTPNGPVSSKASDINYRDEPAAFFFVLFGIAFEALVGRPGSDSIPNKDQTLEILQALKKILLPGVSGQAIYQEAVFSETMDLLDRLVLTQGLDVQTVVVEIVRNLCKGHPSAQEREETNGVGESLSDDIDQLFELTRIIVLILAGLLPNLTESKLEASQQPLSNEAVTLIQASLDALIDAAEVFPAVIRTDLHACIIHIFATILGTPAYQAAVVPQALPISKRFIFSITNPDPDPTVVIQIRGCLKRYLSILLHAQKGETEASLLCVRNTLLASTILLSGGVNIIPPNDPLLVRLLDEMVDCLDDRLTAKVAANCIRSLLLVSPKSPADQAIARHLLPRLLTFVTNTSAEDPENARALIAHALCAFVPILEPSKTSTGLALLIPALLSRASTEGHAVYRETSARLLELAGVDQGGFRTVVGSLSAEQRAFMEEVIREGAKRGDGVGEKRVEGRGPSIALKMNFGASS